MYNILIRYMGHPYLPTLISPRYTVPYIYKYMIYIDDILFFGSPQYSQYNMYVLIRIARAYVIKDICHHPVTTTQY